MIKPFYIHEVPLVEPRITTLPDGTFLSEHGRALDGPVDSMIEAWKQLRQLETQIDHDFPRLQADYPELVSTVAHECGLPVAIDRYKRLWVHVFWGQRAVEAIRKPRLPKHDAFEIDEHEARVALAKIGAAWRLHHRNADRFSSLVQHVLESHDLA